MQNCKIVQNSLSAYLHNELDSESLKAMHQHLSQCPLCLKEEIGLRQTSRLLNKFPIATLPENFDWELQKKLNLLQQPAQKIKPEIRRIIYAIAATLVITIGLEFLIFQFMRTRQPTSQFTDFQTAQAVFKSEVVVSGLSLKQRYAEKFQQQQAKLSLQKNL